MAVQLRQSSWPMRARWRPRIRGWRPARAPVAAGPRSCTVRRRSRSRTPWLPLK